MTATELLDELRTKGVHLTIEGGYIAVDAPKGVLTDDLRQAIREHKVALIELLARPDTRAPVWRCRTCARMVEIRTMFWGECQACHPQPDAALVAAGKAKSDDGVNGVPLT